MTVSAEYAAEHLAELFDAADRGEEVEIARGAQPVLKLVKTHAVEAALSKEQIAAKRRMMIGAGKGKIWVADDWDSPEINAAIAKDFDRIIYCQSEVEGMQLLSNDTWMLSYAADSKK